ncbi:hypothetical protein CRE_24816 [Caenorhabditis remanei]|uniref:Uncharacterized protein n=1 Tax=Caenorhabditis remanei TaxID=31234 RepID=E3NHN5_CAERE|nr:hypothetical protein CRE_24816 [Caenorhabditis remanei]
MSGNGNKQPTSSNQSKYPIYHSNGWIDLDPTMSIWKPYSETWHLRPPPPQPNATWYFERGMTQSEIRRSM